MYTTRWVLEILGGALRKVYVIVQLNYTPGTNRK